MKTNYIVKAIILILISTVASLSSCKREYLHPKDTKTGIFFKVNNGKQFNMNINIYDDRGNTLYTNETGYVLDDYYAADLKPDEIVFYTIVMTDKIDSSQVCAKKDVRVLYQRVSEVILYPKAPKTE